MILTNSEYIHRPQGNPRIWGEYTDAYGTLYRHEAKGTRRLSLRPVDIKRGERAKKKATNQLLHDLALSS